MRRFLKDLAIVLATAVSLVVLAAVLLIGIVQIDQAIERRHQAASQRLVVAEKYRHALEDYEQQVRELQQRRQWPVLPPDLPPHQEFSAPKYIDSPMPRGPFTLPQDLANTGASGSAVRN